jgi:phage host-nuclease inhibitor protein Gam
MARAKKKVFTEVTFDNAQAASQQYAVTSNKLQKIEAKMNEEINKIKSKYQDDINELTESLVEPMEMLQVFAQEQKESWGKKKSIELLHCTIGFRTGTPKVTKDKKFTWDGITELVRKLFPNLVRVKVELDKENIIAMRDEASFAQVKEKCYIDVEQDETFFVIPKVEELQTA